MIIIPMAGMSSRFFKAGYTVPKFMLEAHGKSLFSHCVGSFEKYFSTESFLFIVRNAYEARSFVDSECKNLGICHYQIVTLTEETRGQAETVYIGLSRANTEKSEPITIFNIDTIRPNFSHPKFSNAVDGYLEVFKGKGLNWSFAKEDPNMAGKVIETAEKNPISDLCSDGLYYFRSANLFMDYFEKMDKDGNKALTKGELYIAPMYNYLIKDDLFISYSQIDSSDVIFSGTPQEYNSFILTSKK